MALSGRSAARETAQAAALLVSEWQIYLLDDRGKSAPVACVLLAGSGSDVVLTTLGVDSLP
jgi:hypothetical protein